MGPLGPDPFGVGADDALTRLSHASQALAKEAREIAAAPGPDRPRRRRHPQRRGRVATSDETRLADQRGGQHVGVAVLPQALHGMVIVPRCRLRVRRFECDAEIQTGLTLTKGVALGGLDRQRLLE